MSVHSQMQVLATYADATYISDATTGIPHTAECSGTNWAYFCWNDTECIENDASNSSSITESIFVAAVTSLPSRCLAMTRRCAHTQAENNTRRMKYAIEKGSGAMIYIPSLVHPFNSW
jgi:hypothetical protein